MYQLPSLQQQMAALRIAELHKEAAHARLVKEARGARRARRSSSRRAVILAAVRGSVASIRGSAAKVATRPAPATPCTD